MNRTTFPTRTLCYFSLAYLFLCGYGPCSSSHCPTGATTGPDYGCWYEIAPRQDSLSINHGELQIRIHDPSYAKQSSHRLYRFAFVRDPKEQLVSQSPERIGHWKLEISPQQAQQLSETLALSWKLRDPRPLLHQKETVRFAVSWMEQKQRKYQILPGRYDENQHRLYAVLSSQILANPHAYLVPMRYKTQYLATAPSGSFPSRFASFVNVAAVSR